MNKLLALDSGEFKERIEELTVREAQPKRWDADRNI
jgi:hypothetical protein